MLTCGARRLLTPCALTPRCSALNTGLGDTPCGSAAGAVLPIWKVLTDTVIPDEDKKVKASDMSSVKAKDHARVVRLKLDSGEPIIGLNLISEDVPRVSLHPVLRAQPACC